LLLTILNNEGNLSLSGLSPNQVSYQNLVWDPSFNLKEPSSIKESLMFIKLFQKWESVGFLTQLPKVLSLIYLFISNSYHMPSSFNNLYSHLLNKHLFWISKFWIPRPPWSLGWHITFHLANLYFCLCWSFCQ
jgi:hypothetical protein